MNKPDTSRLYRDVEEFRAKNPDKIVGALTKLKPNTYMTVNDFAFIFPKVPLTTSHDNPIHNTLTTLTQLRAAIDSLAVEMKKVEHLTKVEWMQPGDEYYSKRVVSPNYEVTMLVRRKTTPW